MAQPVIAVGCIGGSGSRAVARIIQSMGYYIGDDLNAEMDNLWFTLLFKRPSILLESTADLEFLYHMFRQRMSHGTLASDTFDTVLKPLTFNPRPPHPAEWLNQRRLSFLDESGRHEDKIAWKEPNTHVIIDRLLNIDPSLSYIHITRDGLDMAYSSNMNQLQLWGPIFMNRPISVQPRDALSYWVCVERRMRRLKTQYPDRILIIRYEDLVLRPLDIIPRLASFCQADEGICVNDLSRLVIKPDTIGRSKTYDLSAFLEDDVAYAEAISQDPT
ncbi:sulfotransferase [Aquabacter sp. L1I39]|uniref:sulfotransferase family protein n=1 Tax=Aquabacter sp. L1I39 TaxID=2820278 RepID=UPI001ADB4736|nr:sulfotransferase [Aquabacter sp. L1I39]QTL02433.1 sulfotransferase [Aquabacter sp. L1I39]